MQIVIVPPRGPKENFTVYSYDDNFSLLERYALSKEQALPSYFRIDTALRRFKDGEEVEIADVREVLSKIDARTIIDKSFVQALLASYPGLTKKDVGILWARLRNLTPSQYSDTLNKLDRLTFPPNAVEDLYNNYPRDVEKIRKTLKEKVNAQSSTYKKLEELEDVPLEPTEVEEITSVTVLRLPNNENLIEVFDAFDVSRELPFMILIYRGRKYYKAYKHLPPSVEWIDSVEISEGAVLGDSLHFWILNTSPSKVSTSTRTAIENFYSAVQWTENNKISIDLNIHRKASEQEIFKKEEEVYQRVYNALGDRLKVQLLRSGQSGIKATFRVSNLQFIRAAFADMVFNNRLMSEFLFFDESRKTTMMKDRFYAYYSLGALSGTTGARINNKERAISISITVQPGTGTEEDPAGIEVRVSKATNVQQIHAFRTVFSKLLRLYLDEENKVNDIYSELIPNYKSLTAIATKKAKQDKKSGRRALLLKKYNDSLFPKGPYAGECQKKFQPYPVTEEEANIIAEDDPYKVINFPLGSKDWYACAPREPGEVKAGEKAADYPGLKVTKAAKFPEYREQYPLVPCCFKVEQYTKKASDWRLYVQQIEQLRREGTSEEEIARFFGDPIEAAELGKRKISRNPSDIGFVKKTVKIVGPDRYGVLPFNLEKLLPMLGYEKFHRPPDLELYPVLRHGVVWSDDSFLHCLERAFNASYFSMSSLEHRERILEVRRDLSELNFEVAKQELYDYSDSEIQAILGDPQAYIDPNMFISLAQKYYADRIGEKIQIFLFEVDASSPDGEIVIPRYSQAYLGREYSETIKSVFIIKYASETRDYPYQCEIVANLEVIDDEVTGISFVFENTPLLETIIKLFYDANEVHIIDPEIERLYVPVNTSTV